MRTYLFVRKNSWLFLGLAVYAAAQLARIALHPVLMWDEAVYVSIGKFFLSAGKVGLYEALRPPLVPVAAGIAWLAGFSIEALRVIMLLVSVAAVVVFYFIAKKYEDRKTALLASLLLAFTPLFFSQGILVLTEIPALLLILLAVYCAEKKKYFISGIFSGLAFLAKFPAGLILPIIIAKAFFEKKQQIVEVIGGFAVTALPYFAFNRVLLGSAFSPLLLASRHGANTAYAVSPWLLNVGYYLIEPIKDNFLLALALPGLWLMRRTRLFWVPGLVFFVYFTLIVNKQLRYAVFLLPAFAYLASLTLRKLWTFNNLRVAVCCIAILGGVVALNNYVGMLHEQNEYPEAVVSYIQHSSATTILTSDPVPAAYADRRFLPFYFFVFDEKNATAAYESGLSEAGLVLFTPQVFACELYPGTECRRMVEELHARLEKEGRLVLHTKNRWEEYFIYEPTRPQTSTFSSS